jgi:hypothetical protein
MTDQQKKSIEQLHEGFAKKCERFSGWGSASICRFTTYFNESNPNDKNLVVDTVEIDGISDDNQVFTKVKNILVEPDGTVYVLEDLFSKNKVVTYLSGLKQFDWRS